MACRQITERLATFAKTAFGNPDFTQVPLAKLVTAAHEQRIDLGARGFYATPGVDFDREKGQGQPFYYFTNGAAVAEILIDRFLGDIKVQRVDLLMDLGRMINRAIDRGQVIGGFVQGMGWVTTEALMFDRTGRLLSDSATTYKIPNMTDIPLDFRVDFIDNPHNQKNVYGNKAVGEPPLLLGVAVWAAIKSALSTLTPGRSRGLNVPATGEEVLMRLTDAESPPVPTPSENGAATTSRVKSRV
jgi:xanthine dehydrogenase large subunit